MDKLRAVFKLVVIAAVAVGTLVLMCMAISGYTDEFFGTPWAEDMK